MKIGTVPVKQHSLDAMMATLVGLALHGGQVGRGRLRSEVDYLGNMVALTDKEFSKVLRDLDSRGWIRSAKTGRGFVRDWCLTGHGFVALNQAAVTNPEVDLDNILGVKLVVK